MFFAPRDNPEIAGVVFGEHNEHGSTSAPIAKHVMETYFAKKDGTPLPKLDDAGAGPESRAGRAARAAAAVPVAEAPRPRDAEAGTEMFERRLYLHIDWLLLGAIACAVR